MPSTADAAWRGFLDGWYIPTPPSVLGDSCESLTVLPQPSRITLFGFFDRCQRGSYCLPYSFEESYLIRLFTSSHYPSMSHERLPRPLSNDLN